MKNVGKKAYEKLSLEIVKTFSLDVMAASGIFVQEEKGVSWGTSLDWN